MKMREFIDYINTFAKNPESRASYSSLEKAGVNLDLEIPEVAVSYLMKASKKALNVATIEEQGKNVDRLMEEFVKLRLLISKTSMN